MFRKFLLLKINLISKMFIKFKQRLSALLKLSFFGKFKPEMQRGRIP